jgi:hypothetical protein
MVELVSKTEQVSEILVFSLNMTWVITQEDLMHLVNMKAERYRFHSVLHFVLERFLDMVYI